jgi:hypothetical protein
VKRQPTRKEFIVSKTSNPNTGGNAAPDKKADTPATNPTATPQPKASGDALPANLSELALPQNFAEAAGVKKVITTVPVGKRQRHEFLQLHPDPSWRLTTGILELKQERGESYLVAPGLWNDVGDFIQPTTLYTGITLQKVLFLLPVRLPGPDGRINQWHESLREAAELAMGSWVSIRANMALGAYEVHQARAELPAPSWPDVSFDDVVRIAFKGRYVADLDHPVLRRLRGEIA